MHPLLFPNVLFSFCLHKKAFSTCYTLLIKFFVVGDKFLYEKKGRIQSESLVLFNAPLITCFLITGSNDPLFYFFAWAFFFSSTLIDFHFKSRLVCHVALFFPTFVRIFCSTKCPNTLFESFVFQNGFFFLSRQKNSVYRLLSQDDVYILFFFTLPFVTLHPTSTYQPHFVLQLLRMYSPRRQLVNLAQECS